MDEASLINLVEGYSILYDKTRSDFKDTKKKENVWNAIAQQLGQPVGVIKQCWKSIREKYSREKRTMATVPSGSAAVEIKWPLYKSLSFLEKHVISRITSSNVLPSTPETNPETSTRLYTQTSCTPTSAGEETMFVEYIEDEFAEPEVMGQFVEHVSLPLLANTPTPSSSRVPQNLKRKHLWEDRKKKAKKESLEDVVGEALGSVSTLLEKTQNMNSDTAFGAYVGLALQELAKEEKSTKKMQIMEILNT